MAKRKSFRTGDFSGGLATIFSISKMPLKFSTAMKNVCVSSDKGIAKIPGYLRLSNYKKSHNFTSYFEYQTSDGTVIELAAGNGIIYKNISGIPVIIKFGLDVDAKVRFTSVNDNCLIFNGVDVPMKYDGVTVTDLKWVPPIFDCTFLSSTRFLAAGDRTDEYVAGRGINARMPAADDEGTVVSAVYNDGTDAGLGVGTTNTRVSSGDFTYSIDGVSYFKAAVPAGTALPAGRIHLGKRGIFLFSINAAGVIAVTPGARNDTGYDSFAEALSGLPSTPADQYAMGYVTLMTNGHKHMDVGVVVSRPPSSVGFPMTAHGFASGILINVENTENYDNEYTVRSDSTVDEIRVDATYIAEETHGHEIVSEGFIVGTTPIDAEYVTDHFHSYDLEDKSTTVTVVDAVLDATLTAVDYDGQVPVTAFKGHVHKGRVWTIERTNKMQATHSALSDDDDYFTANNAGYFDFKFVLKRGDELVDIFTYVDLLVFMFKNHIAIYSGSNPTATGDFNLVQLIEGTGQVGTDAGFQAGTDYAFVTPSGVKTLQQVISTGNLSMGNASAAIEPTIKAAIANNPDGPFGAAYFKERGWFMVLIGDIIYVFDPLFRAWSTIEGADVYGIFGNIEGEVFLAGSGYIYKYGQGFSFDGDPITWIWEPAWWTLHQKGLEVFPKRLRIINDYGAVATIEVEMRYDKNRIGSPSFVSSFVLQTAPSLMDVDPGGKWDDVFFMDSGDVNSPEIPLFGSGVSMQLRLSNTSTEGPMIINDLTVYSEIGGR